MAAGWRGGLRQARAHGVRNERPGGTDPHGAWGVPGPLVGRLDPRRLVGPAGRPGALAMATTGGTGPAMFGCRSRCKGSFDRTYWADVAADRPRHAATRGGPRVIGVLGHRAPKREATIGRAVPCWCIGCGAPAAPHVAWGVPVPCYR